MSKGASVSTKKKPENISENMLPEALAPSQLVEVVARLARSHDYAEALAIANLMGAQSMAPLAQEMLSELGGSLSYGLRYSHSTQGKSLAWAAKLMEWGAMPFAHEGMPGESGYKKSFFEKIVAGGYWAYAGLLVEADPDGAALAGSAFARIGQAERRRWFDEKSQSTTAQELLAQAGAKALGVGFKAGMDPKGKARGQPWIFSCVDADSLRAFVQAGADPSERNSLGQTLSESIAARAPSRARQDLLSLARQVQSTESGGDKASAEREALALARAGSGAREVVKAAKAAGLEIRDIKSTDGMPMLGVAIEAGNWGLVADLLKNGADARASTPQGFPLSALILAGGSYTNLHSSGAKLTKAKECVAQLIDGIDFSWRDADGSPLLEAFAKTRAGAQGSAIRLDYDSMSRWVKREPIDAANPLWARLDALGQDAWAIRTCAEKRPEEPWSAGGRMLMELLLTGDLPTGMGRESWSVDNGLGKFLQCAGMGEGARERMERICAPEQWEAAFAAFWSGAGQRGGSDYKKQEMAKRLESAMEYWVSIADKLGMEAFDMGRLSKSLTSGWAAGANGEPPPVNAGEWVERFAKKICSRLPYKAGALLLDILDQPGRAPIEVGYRVWRHCQEEKIKLALPESHPLLSEPGRVGTELANHPVWRQLEEHLVERESLRTKKVRL